tara:strand:+ start:2181 stop:2378 length:198 start_codon:yes stop_codon:yes gene_type:complete
MLKNLLALFFLVNALFWGLAPHKQHCKVASMFGMKKCPPHWIHVYVMGLGSFLLTLYIVQGKAGL